MKKIRIKSPYRLSFNDAILAAEYLVKNDNIPNKTFRYCQKTLRLLKELKKRLNYQAIGDNLVWYAFRVANR